LKARAPRGHAAVPRRKSVDLHFDDNHIALQVFGSHHTNLARIEQMLDVAIHPRGNEITIAGSPAAVDAASAALARLLQRARDGLPVEGSEVDAAIRMVSAPGDEDLGPVIRTQKRHITVRSPGQARYLQAMDASALVFGLGPAGTGKTYLAVAKAVEKLIAGEVERIVLSRPAVEAGEQLGFLPGDMREKVDPYLRPLYDALHDMMPAPQVAKRLENGEIEVAPLAFMRGRTLAHAFVILDEAQNTTSVQMKMFLTRLGENARMVITGDLSQVDLPRGTRSGLRDAVEILAGVSEIGVVEFTQADVVRHPLVTRIVQAYESVEEKRGTALRYESSEQPAKPSRRPRSDTEN
jgi:phosphate starvation-inducible PhoH-like protein